MDKKYLRRKINEFINEKKIEPQKWKIIDWEESKTDFFINTWLKTRKKTSPELKELNNNPLSDLKKAVEEIIETKQANYQKKENEKEIQHKLENLFTKHVEKHVGSLMLKEFYSEFEINYDLSKARMKNAGRIAKFRKKIREKDEWDSWLISGKIMKEKLKLNYNNPIDGKTYEQIDGWCFTKNKEWIEQYLKHEITKYENIARTYEGFQKKWKSI